MSTTARTQPARWEITALLLIAACGKLGAQQTAVGGHILDSHLLPVPGAEVILIEPRMLTLTDSSGAYQFCAVAGDSVSIVARAVGFRSDQTKIVLGAGANVTQDLTLIRLQADEVPAPYHLLHLPRRVRPSSAPCIPSE